jgi:hypothetical protein
MANIQFPYPFIINNLLQREHCHFLTIWAALGKEMSEKEV